MPCVVERRSESGWFRRWPRHQGEATGLCGLWGAGMKWKSKRHKEAELRAASWDALPSVDLLFSTKDATELRALRTGKPPSLDQRFNTEDIKQLQLSIRGTVVLPTDLTYHR